jgi:hypothetical protein
MLSMHNNIGKSRQAVVFRPLASITERERRFEDGQEIGIIVRLNMNITPVSGLRNQ